MASRRQTWFAALWCSFVTACVRLDESHCANLDGDATCAERDAALPYCSMCTAKHDGCTMETVTPACTPAEGTDSTTGVTSIASSVGDDDDDPSLTSDPADADASVGEATTLGITATMSGSSSSDDGSSDGGTTAASHDGSSEDASSDSASSDTSSDTGAECGNGIREGDEQCDGDDLNGATCLEQLEYADGVLSCDQHCVFNTSQCDACVAVAGVCVTDDYCCVGHCNLGLCVL
jgi:hypothetical protein